MKKDSGFSLIELSVVILIISLLLVTSFEGSKYFLIQNHIKATNVKLNAIQRAIEIYVRRTGHLPCPAPLKKTSGSSNVDDCSTLSNNDGDGIYKEDQILVGGVPYRDLDLTADLSHDSWGGKFVYSIYLPAAKNIRELQDNNDYLKIYENDFDDNNNLITKNAVYSLVSMGRNKYGAYEFNTNNKITSTKANAAEQKNWTDDDDKNVVVYFSDQTQGDDIVRYKTKTQLIVDTELEDLNCCISNNIVNNLIDSLDIEETITFTGSEISSTTECNMLYNAEINGTGDSTKTKYKLKCFKYGRLGILKVNQ